jgi:hypothetical protein
MARGSCDLMSRLLEDWLDLLSTVFASGDSKTSAEFHASMDLPGFSDVVRRFPDAPFVLPPRPPETAVSFHR